MSSLFSPMKPDTSAADAARAKAEAEAKKAEAEADAAKKAAAAAGDEITAKRRKTRAGYIGQFSLLGSNGYLGVKDNLGA